MNGLMRTGIFLAVVGSLSFIRTPSSHDRNHVEKQNADTARVLSYEPSISSSTDLSEYHYHKASYLINAPIDLVWNTYCSVDPSLAWDGPVNNLKLSYSNQHQFKQDDFGKGTIFLIDLQLLSFYQIDVLLKITKIDQKNKMVELCYADENVTHGKQRISFHKQNGKCIVKHETWYKSKSNFRDKHLYPHFHEKCIDEYHTYIHSRVILEQIPDDMPVVAIGFFE